MTEGTKGILAMVIACVTWGLSPIYYAMLKHVPPFEVLCYRALWSLAFFAGILLLQGRLREIATALKSPKRFMIVTAAAVLISVNWFGYIYAISTAQGVEASLGYYIFPIVAVVLGRVVFGERLDRLQWLAVALVTGAVVVLTAGLGVAPWIALVLAVTFGFYGVIKKQLDLGPVVSVTAEVLILSPIAIGWIVVAGTGAGGGNDIKTHVLLALSGPLTATPLILLSYAARRARLSTLGLVQYLNPSLQFFCAVVIFAEPFTRWHGIAFAIIWAALALYSVASLRQDRAARKRASSVGTSGTTVA
ncbi:EamA family transporter RarD [Yoonia sp. 208BN28-4]|uniref:EamA family transporter RarD n=1 Tax=Yoonia sp. 208BN28-4 TaxID=3126505 RepID=UPI0030B1C0E5